MSSLLNFRSLRLPDLFTPTLQLWRSCIEICRKRQSKLPLMQGYRNLRKAQSKLNTADAVFSEINYNLYSVLSISCATRI